MMIKKLVDLIEKENIADSIKDRSIITATPNGTFFALKIANVKSSKASLDAMIIIKLAAGICRGVFIKDYAIY